MSDFGWDLDELAKGCLGRTIELSPFPMLWLAPLQLHRNVLNHDSDRPTVNLY